MNSAKKAHALRQSKRPKGLQENEIFRLGNWIERLTGLDTSAYGSFDSSSSCTCLTNQPPLLRTRHRLCSLRAKTSARCAETQSLSYGLFFLIIMVVLVVVVFVISRLLYVYSAILAFSVILRDLYHFLSLLGHFLLGREDPTFAFACNDSHHAEH